jgi:tetratricopeptide (TPR) repeat protein
MKNIKSAIIAIGILNLAILSGCAKQDQFLAVKTDQSLAVPTSLTDYQALLLNENLFNKNAPVLGMITANDYYLTSTTWANMFTNTERNAYIWAHDLFEGGTSFTNDWTFPYQQVYVANTVLEGVTKIPVAPGNLLLYNQIKGTALFYRAVAFYNLVQTFAMPYDQTTSGTDLGIPLRLSSDLNINSVRPNVQQCYDQVLQDLKSAADLLPVTTALPTQPSSVAANAMLARVYLAISSYGSAATYTDKALAQYNTLVDYNTITPLTFAITNTFLKEDIFHTCITNSDATSRTDAIIDTSVYKLYDQNDLRKSVYFYSDGSIRDRSSYDYKSLKYNGLATDELYLIRAECYARAGDVTNALSELNTLLLKRFKTGTFIPVTATNADDALGKILTERRKECVFRGLRWTDLRRLNKDPRFQLTLTRVINGVTYTLPPNDPRYAMPIPPNEIALSGIQQNVR